MTVAARFNAWRVVVIVTLLANVAYAFTGSITAASISTISLVAMLALLATTPMDAIVLPRGRSERVIVAGFAIAASIATRGHLQSVACAIVTLAIGATFLAVCRRRSLSAWWVAVALWQPVVLSAIRATV